MVNYKYDEHSEEFKELLHDFLNFEETGFFFCFAILSLLSFSAWIGILCVGNREFVYNTFGDRIGEEKTVIY